jgi:3-hydroxybutyryl-CoA dehydrogenase|tara:strand:- start:19396 stop:20061 length:666 start_codon:yes stop_codon:yes gene_type:complete
MYRIVNSDNSRSFPSPHDFIASASRSESESEVRGGLVFTGIQAGRDYLRQGSNPATFVAIELELECLGVYTGLDHSEEHQHTVGFARFRMGSAEPSQLIELVRHAWTSDQAVALARTAFENSGLVVAICEDFPGRIVNTLIRPYLNAALSRLDEKLATAEDLDKTLCLGLGYPEGPIELLARTGLAEHYDVTSALYFALGQESYAPARRAHVSKQRHKGII